MTPYRIETERLVIRCYDPRDAAQLKDAVDRSREHLWPWMPWTPAEPEPLDDVVERLRSFRAQFDADENWIMGIWSRDESRLLGGTGLHPRGGEGSLEIGYWVAVDAIGQGIATEVTAVLTRVGFELIGLDRVDVQVEPPNERSAKVARKLAFTYEGTLRRRLPRREGEPRADSMVFTMLREELGASPCMSFDYVAYDAIGRRL
ncbi:MAG: GNAT family N-acetyltransferase [Gaiellaceae bacterium]